MGATMGKSGGNLLDSLPSTQGTLHVVMLGLDSAGKTTALYRLKFDQYLNTVPTIGFNCEKVRGAVGKAKGAQFLVWDVGGQEKLRPLWRSYTRCTDGIVFVVDSVDVERMEEAKMELMRTAKCPDNQGVPVLVLANKQDLPGAREPKELEKLLGLHELSPLYPQSTIITSSSSTSPSSSSSSALSGAPIPTITTTSSTSSSSTSSSSTIIGTSESISSIPLATATTTISTTSTNSSKYHQSPITPTSTMEQQQQHQESQHHYSLQQSSSTLNLSHLQQPYSQQQQSHQLQLHTPTTIQKPICSTVQSPTVAQSQNSNLINLSSSPTSTTAITITTTATTTTTTTTAAATTTTITPTITNHQHQQQPFKGWFIQPACAITGEGLQEGLEALYEMILKKRKINKANKKKR